MRKCDRPQKENAEYERRGREFFIYLLRPGCARFSSALLHPSARSLCRPGGLCFSQAPVFSAIWPANPDCPASPKGPCAAPPQAPSVAARRRRYNTLDLATQDRVPREALPPLDTPATKPPGFIGCFPTGKKQNENRDAHSAFSLPKRTPSPLKTSVNETKVSMKTFLPSCVKKR